MPTIHELSTYRGSCHCRAYRFTVLIPAVETVASCNCSLCRKTGSLWVFPEQRDIKVTKGTTDTLRTYEANGVRVEFCPTCGTLISGVHRLGPYAERPGINARALLDVNPFRITSIEIDGRSYEDPIYGPPQFTGIKPSFDKLGFKTYLGACHCGDITLCVKTKPLPEVVIKEDNCSICVRNAWIGIYPCKAQVALVGSTKAQDYLFGRRFGSQAFCKSCGVVVFQNLYGPPKHIVDTWPEARKEIYRKNMDLRPVNIRVLEGVEWADLTINRSDEGTEGYLIDD